MFAIFTRCNGLGTSGDVTARKRSAAQSEIRTRLRPLSRLATVHLIDNFTGSRTPVGDNSELELRRQAHLITYI